MIRVSIPGSSIHDSWVVFYDCFSLFPLSPSFTISFWFVFNHWKKNISCSHYFRHTLFVIRVWLSIRLSVNKKNIFCVVSLVFPSFTICDSWLIFGRLNFLFLFFFLKYLLCSHYFHYTIWDSCLNILCWKYVRVLPSIMHNFLVMFNFYDCYFIPIPHYNHDSYFLVGWLIFWRHPIGSMAPPVPIHEWPFFM